MCGIKVFLLHLSVLFNVATSRPYVRQMMTNAGERRILIDDMLLDTDQYMYHYGSPNSRSGIRGKRYRWPKGIIPYEIAHDYSEDQLHTIESSIDTLNSELEGCIKIRPATSYDKNKVVVQSLTGCFSSVGRQGTKSSQILSLKAEGCVTPGTVMHEFIHAVGFFHEQSRPDRDEYIELVPENIKKGTESNFRKVSNTVTYGVPYDYKSIMHYRFNAFATDKKKPTIKSKNPHEVETKDMSSRYPTDYDIMKIRRMYKCGEGEYGEGGGGGGGGGEGGDYEDGGKEPDYHEYVVHGEGEVDDDGGEYPLDYVSDYQNVKNVDGTYGGRNKKNNNDAQSADFNDSSDSNFDYQGEHEDSEYLAYEK